MIVLKKTNLKFNIMNTIKLKGDESWLQEKKTLKDLKV